MVNRSTGGGRLFLRYPRRADPSVYLQQEEQLPPEQFLQELQVVLQQLLQELSAARAVASPSPAMTASMAPTLISVFICFCVVCFEREEFPLHWVICRNTPKSPQLFLQGLF
jgi:hypothetical protein